jgi:UDP-3-O-[3-hydroxymyristoyl] N-acetylglucosamine deacetylase
MLATSISENNVTISCVEHLMSAFWSMGIDNVIVEIDNEEVPIMDGSAAPFIYLIKTAGIQEQTAQRRYIRIKKSLRIEQGDATAELLPYDGFKASYQFIYDHHVYNRFPKFAEIDFSKTSFVDEVSRARTFGLIKELDQAQALNRCLGSSLENAVAIDDYNIVNQDGLRYEDEFVKHKLLDAIGDLYLLGHTIIGEFKGYKSGHTTNNLLARALTAQTEAWEYVSFDEKQSPLAKSFEFLQPLSA